MAVEDKSVHQMQAAAARLLQSTPGLADKLAASGAADKILASSKTPQRRPSVSSGREERDATMADLHRQLESEKGHAKRETQSKGKSEERRQSEGAAVDEHGQRMAVIGNMHKSVVAGLECIQDNTAKILQDQEKDLMRAFRARLQEVSKDLEAQRSRKGEDSTQLLQRHRRVVAELHEAQELANTFDKKNQQLVAENQKLQEKLRTREDDRQALLRELVLSKKEVARLKAQQRETPGAPASIGEQQPAAEGGQAAEDTEAAKPLARSLSSNKLEQAKQQQTRNRQYEAEIIQRETIAKLKRVLEAERRTVRALKQQEADMLQQRSELEVFLRQCLDDVKCEITRNRLEESQEYGSEFEEGDGPATAMSVHELSAKDRERVLELLLSQQRVVQLLYSKTFAASSPGTEMPSGQGPSTDAGPKRDDFSWLSDIIPKDVPGA